MNRILYVVNVLLTVLLLFVIVYGATSSGTLYTDKVTVVKEYEGYSLKILKYTNGTRHPDAIHEEIFFVSVTCDRDVLIMDSRMSEDKSECTPESPSELTYTEPEAVVIHNGSSLNIILLKDIK